MVPKIVCRTCGAGPLNGVALFTDGYDADDEGVRNRPRRYCPTHLPLAAVRARIERQTGPLLDLDVLAVFDRRLADRS